MEIAKAIEFARQHHNAVLHTYRADGSPQLSPVTVGVDGEDRLIVSTRETAVKTKNLERDPRATLCLLNDKFYGEWLVVSGRAEVVHLPDALELLVGYYRDLRGEHPDWDDYRAAMVRDRRVMVRITPEHAGPDIAG
jgi:PPOX class probable F420-dependent enzyme